MLSILSDFFVKLIAQALPFLVRRYYTPEKIAEKIRIRISSDGDGIALWGGELPRAKAWLEITNLSPFAIRFDRIYGNFWYGTQLAQFVLLKQQSVDSTQDIRVYIEAELTPSHAEYIRKNQGKMNAKLEIGALGVCKVNQFELFRTVQTGNVQLHNFNIPT